MSSTRRPCPCRALFHRLPWPAFSYIPLPCAACPRPATRIATRGRGEAPRSLALLALLALSFPPPGITIVCLREAFHSVLPCLPRTRCITSPGTKHHRHPAPFILAFEQQHPSSPSLGGRLVHRGTSIHQPAWFLPARLLPLQIWQRRLHQPAPPPAVAPTRLHMPAATSTRAHDEKVKQGAFCRNARPNIRQISSQTRPVRDARRVPS